jgi:peptide/nickel transport system substrate-binding protein
MFKKLFSVVSLLIAFSMVLAACAPTTQIVTQVVQQTSVVKETSVVQQTSVVKETQIVVVTPTPEPVTRKGGWLDQLVFSVVSSDSAVTQIKAGAIDTFAYALSSAQLPAIQAAGLNNAAVLGTYYDIMYNPSACKDTTKLNPFADRKIREATNMLYDRNYINQEIYAGGGLPKFFAIMTNGPDYADLADVARGLESKYAYNLDAAKKAIATEMTGLGATLGADGKWAFQNNPVTLAFLIRSDGDGTRKPMGDYVSSQLEAVGFTVDRQYKKSSQAGPIWQKSDPTECQWNMYTAGWINQGIERDAKGDFQQMYLNTSGQGIQPFLSNVADPAFQKVGDDLAVGNFTSLDSRRQMMAQALTLSLQDSLQVMIIDSRSFAPYATNVQVSANLSGGIETAPIAFYTLRFKGQVGGVMKWGESDLFSEPWNPVAGSNWAWDQGALAAIDGAPFMSDPYTGLNWPLRAEKADVTVQTGLPVFKTLDWVTLNTADTIPVPADAWVDWNAKDQKFITAGEAFTQTVNAKVKVVVTFPADMFDTVTWHDGSKLSVGDFIMNWIMTFDRAKKDSAIYDDQAVPTFESFMASFKGIKIDSTSPFVFEFYTDNYYSDAELNAWDYLLEWPNYGFGEAPWDVMAIANLAEAAGEAAYSPDKSQAKKIDQTSFVGGPTLDVLSKYLDQSITANTVPYSPTLGTYIKADEATTRYANLKAWYTAHGNYQLGTGPYYLDKAFLVEKSLVLKPYLAYPDLANRWSNFAEPKIAVVDITGPAGQVKIGDQATFDIAVTFNGQPYAKSDIKTVKYLLYDATGAVVKTGEATFVSDGQYQVVLASADTSKLTGGTNKFEVAVVSNLVAVPTFNSVQFVTAP